jgi:hypothetical protein
MVLPSGKILKCLKGYVRNKALATSLHGLWLYMYDEVLGFCTKYFALYPHTQHQMWDPNEQWKHIMVTPFATLLGIVL